jgi:hypothetical protein
MVVFRSSPGWEFSMFAKKAKEEVFESSPLWRAYRIAKGVAGHKSRRDAKKSARAFCLSTRVTTPIIENPGKAVVGVLAVAAVLGLGIWGGLALRRKRLSTYHNPYESRKFRRPLTDSGGYEAVGI